MSDGTTRVDFRITYGSAAALTAAALMLAGCGGAPVTTSPPAASSSASSLSTNSASDTRSSEPLTSPGSSSSNSAFAQRNLATDFQPTDQSGISITLISIEGNTYPQSIAMSLGRDTKSYAIYVVAKKYRSFSATIGVDDRAPSGTACLMQIYADGRVVYSKNLTKGQSANVNLPIDGVYELKLESVQTSPAPALGADYSYDYAVFGKSELEAR